jgi:hypothetical protein
VLADAVAQSPRPRAAPASTMVEFDILSRFRHSLLALVCDLFPRVLSDIYVSSAQAVAEIGIAQAKWVRIAGARGSTECPDRCRGWDCWVAQVLEV